MGNMYGPPDQELKQCEENLHKRTQLIEERLLPILGKPHLLPEIQCYAILQYSMWISIEISSLDSDPYWEY